jgi:hypothetical protein
MEKYMLKMWEVGGQQHQLTTLMADLLHHLACLQKEFQRTDLLLFELPDIQNDYVQRFTMMIDSPYPGGLEERFYPDERSDSDTTIATWPDGNEPPPKRAKRCAPNQFVTLSSRSFSAIKQETVLSLKTFLERRMDQGMTNSTKELSAVFSATSAKEMAIKAISIMKKLKMMEDDCFTITDSCIELFCKFPYLKEESSLKCRFKVIREAVIAPSPPCESRFVLRTSFNGCEKSCVTL